MVPVRRPSSGHDAGGGAEAPVRWWAASCVVGSGWLGASVRRLGDRRLGRRQAARLPAPVPVAFPVLASNAAPCWAVWSTGWETRRATATACWRPLKIGMRERVFGRPTGLARPPAGGDRAMRQRRRRRLSGCGLAGAHPGTAPAACTAGDRHRAGPEELGGTGVRRCASGGCASERALGDLRPAPGGSAGVHGCREGGPWPTTVSSTSRGGDGGEHSATAPDAASRGRRRCCACRTAVR